MGHGSACGPAGGASGDVMEEHWQWACWGLGILCALLHGQARYWSARYRELDRYRQDSGWEDEAMFWRAHFTAKTRPIADEENDDAEEVT